MVMRISMVCPLATSLGTGITLISKGKSFCISGPSSLIQDANENDAERINSTNPVFNLLNIAIMVSIFKSEIVIQRLPMVETVPDLYTTKLLCVLLESPQICLIDRFQSSVFHQLHR